MILRALCVGRHQFLSEHVSRLFAVYGLETTPATGLDGALAASRERGFDLVLCDYDLLAVLPLEAWEEDELLSRIPVIAVSLTRPPDEVHLVGGNSIAGFLYLPTLDRATALRQIAECWPVATTYSLPTLDPRHEPAARSS